MQQTMSSCKLIECASVIVTVQFVAPQYLLSTNTVK